MLGYLPARENDAECDKEKAACTKGAQTPKRNDKEKTQEVSTFPVYFIKQLPDVFESEQL